MIVTIFKLTKRNAEVPTVARPIEFSELIAQCKQEGKLLADSASRSEDQLITTYQAIWSTKEDYIEFINNPVVIKFTEDRSQHNLAYGMATEFQILNYED